MRVVTGIGKTSLVASWAAGLRKKGMVVFWHTLRTGDSFTLVCTKLTQLFPEHKRSEVLEVMAGCVGEGRFDGLIDQVIRLLGGFKGAIVFDDYHLCQDYALRMLIRGLCASGVKLVVCSRTRPVELVTLSGVGEVELGPLRVDEVTQFLRSRLPKVRDFGRLLLECASIGGHPLGLELYCSALGSGGVSRPNVLEGFSCIRRCGRLCQIVRNSCFHIFQSLGVGWG